ncbi:hypothetical protein GCM10007870_02100 [Gluconobacter kondonii]|uniref:Transposase n=1 Tax=Gluconobacter kondonii TaxID=941463 RepID=A0ABQ5WMK5_9PROT|nr:hypothetical protein GCM10007870_02100 [Gluconobacter kondonii]
MFRTAELCQTLLQFLHFRAKHEAAMCHNSIYALLDAATEARLLGGKVEKSNLPCHGAIISGSGWETVTGSPPSRL